MPWLPPAFVLHGGGGVRDYSCQRRPHQPSQQVPNNYYIRSDVAYFANDAFGVAAHAAVEFDIDWNDAADSIVVAVVPPFEMLR